MRQYARAPHSRAQCAWCADVELPNEVVLFNTKRTGDAGRKGDTVGTLVCANFECNVNARKRPRSAYLGFLDKLRGRYGPGTFLVLTYPDLSYQTTALADSIRQIVKTRNDAGDARVSALYYDNTALGLDLLGCDWHPSQHDHQILAAAIAQHLATLPLTW